MEARRVKRVKIRAARKEEVDGIVAFGSQD
jgi:hypothetical protein